MASDITGFPREKIDSVDEYLDSYAKFLRQGIDSVDREMWNCGDASGPAPMSSLAASAACYLGALFMHR